MKAVRIHEYGTSIVLKYEDAPTPLITPNEVLVRIVAASVNPVDWKIRDGYMREKIAHSMPLTLGWDVSGVVAAVGSEVTRFSEGDAVYSSPDMKRNGTYAEYVAIREDEIALKPQMVSHIDAASLPLAGLAVWQSLVTSAQLGVGQKILIHAGSGGVGSLAIQLAKSCGAHVITTTSASNRAFVESLGADEVIDYRTQKFEELLQDIDVVFDTLGGTIQDLSWAILKKGGILVSLVKPPSDEKAKELGVRGAYVFIEPKGSDLEQLAKLVDAGELRPIIGAEFALHDIAKAHALSESGSAIGKIVLYVGQP